MDRIRVHRNLHRKDFTLSEYIKGVGWRKFASSPRVYLEDVEFKVSQAGRMRAIRQGKRNVHAFAYGKLLQYDFANPQMLIGSTLVLYNPFKYETFVNHEGVPVCKAELVMLDNEYGVQAWGIVS